MKLMIKNFLYGYAVFGLDQPFVEVAAKNDSRIIYWGLVEQKPCIRNATTSHIIG